ncbi:hypothetical protein [Desulfovibrio sp. JC010]|uniref:hypothetical protein n=1 Tax=Desulfovibrio sp. JC010 TaxID=2593641 RepID=UPI0013D80FAA|nr:hypothetical protein [Desulfovibrio sp. JC010]NDV25577.1 hypothetical protein [Desulfovibrio sp. JC010]
MSILNFEFTDKIIPDAFHGTSAKAAEEILRTQTFVESDDKSFLGKGVYFYEASKKSAIDWAENKHGIDITVIQAKIQLGSCFDLHNAEHEMAFTHLKSQLEYMGKGRDMTDAFVINYMVEKICTQIETVRCSIPKGFRKGYHNPLVKNGVIPRKNEIYICVREQKNILELQEAKGGIS